MLWLETPWSSLFVSRLPPDMTGTLSWAVLNVMTQLSTPGRLLPRWRLSGAMQASASYEKSDPRGEKQTGQAARLCLKKKEKKKMPLKQSHKGTCLFASMQIGNWTSATVWAASSPGRSTLWHSDRATEITFRGRLQKRPPRSPSPLAWLSSVVLVAVVTHEIIFSVHVQSAIYFYSSEGNIKERWSWLRASPAAIRALWLWPTSNSEHPCCLPFDFDGS